MKLFKLSQFIGIAALCGLPLSAALATTCHESETITTFQAQGEHTKALQALDECLSASKTPTAEELTAFNNLVKQVLTMADTTSEEAVYQNFQAVLKSYLFKGVEFEFADHFKTHPKDDEKLFSEVRQSEEKYHFYHDTGRMWSHSRGIALTDQAILWKNLTGDPQRVSFDELKNITLIHELGLSLSGWKVRLNDNEAYELRLSGIPDQAIQSFLTAVIYFINAKKSQEETAVALEVPEREVAILAGWVTLCRDKIQEKNLPLEDLTALDACVATYGKDFKLSKTDSEWLNQLNNEIFAPTDLSFEDAYQNFVTVLSTDFFSDLHVKFKENFDKALAEKLFQELKASEATYYFYFDTGKATTGSRGIALTDQAILWKNMLGTSISWKNLTGSASRVAFDEISKISLIHELGLSSLTGWKLRLNDNKEHDIVLAQLTEENVKMFANAIVYFINIASNANLTLDIPQETQDVLTKTFLERHPEIQSVTDSIFSAIMPNKANEEGEGLITQAQEKMSEGVTKATEFAEKAADEIGKSLEGITTKAQEMATEAQDMATEASTLLGNIISGESGEIETVEEAVKEEAAKVEEAVKEEAAKVEEAVKEEAANKVEEAAKEEAAKVEEAVKEEAAKVEEAVKEEAAKVEEAAKEEAIKSLKDEIAARAAQESQSESQDGATKE